MYEVEDIKDQPVTFVDGAMLADTEGLERRIHGWEKIGDGPLLRPEQPWEGHYIEPAAVIFDDYRAEWRMWYDGMMATSQDGVHWEKPSLGLYRHEGADTNCCVLEDGTRITGTRAVFEDPEEPDPTKRFKMICYRPSYYLAWSPDGMRWRWAQPDPVWANGAGDGLEETSFFLHDDRRDLYRGYMRVWQRHQTVRKVALGESEDLLHWSGPEIIWEAMPHYGRGAQMYGMAVLREGGLYWGLPWVYYTDEALDPELRQTMHLKLAWSHDGVDWTALAPERDAVPLGAQGAFDCGMILARCPVVALADRLRLYYCGWNGRHDRPGSERTAAIGLAELRRCGFLSLEARAEGRLLTERFLFRGESIQINARTASDGYVEAELLSDGGQILKRFSAERADYFSGDATDHRLTWDGSRDLSSLFGQNLMLRLRLVRAEVFAFQATGTPERFSESLGPPPAQCRGICAEPPLIDGHLDDECWQDFDHTGVADAFARFEENLPAEPQTRVLITRDARNLYLAVECEEPLSERLPGERPDGPLSYSREETIEIRLNAPGQGTFFNQLMVTSTGKTQHNWFSVEEGGSCNVSPVVWQARTSSIPGHWYVEIGVPFEALNTTPPRPGDSWRMNIMRHRHLAESEDTSCWSCMFGAHHRNDRSGQLVFEA